MGGPAFVLTVNGTDFVGDSTVHWDGSPRATTFISGTRLTAQVREADIAVVGAVGITVVTPSPGGGTSNALTFEVTEFSPPPPPPEDTYIYLPFVCRNAGARPHLLYLPLISNALQGDR